MKKIGILSDTHSFLHPEISRIFENCDEIWHAGDFGSIEVAAGLQAMKPLRGVFGNIDGIEIRFEFPLVNIFQCEEVKVLIKHIGGYPGKYDNAMKQTIQEFTPGLVICGHSHILKVMYDDKLNHLHINPGAAGRYGAHNVCTMIRLVVAGAAFKDLEVIELPKW